MIWLVIVLGILSALAAAFGVWQVVGGCLLVWFAVAAARVFNR